MNKIIMIAPVWARFKINIQYWFGDTSTYSGIVHPLYAKDLRDEILRWCHGRCS